MLRFLLSNFILLVQSPSWVRKFLLGVNLLDLVTVILIVWSSSLKISYDRSVATLDFDSNKFFSCNAMLSQMRTINIISCVLIMLLMVALLRYIADLIPILNTFVMMITSVQFDSFFDFSSYYLMSQVWELWLSGSFYLWLYLPISIMEASSMTFSSSLTAIPH